MTWQPLRAFKENFDPYKVRYPLYVSPKYDGIQAIVNEKQQLLSRRLRLIQNDFCRSRFEDARLIGCQGELIAGPPTAPDVMSRTTSAVMSKDTVDKELAFYVFDWYMRDRKPFKQALEYLLYNLEVPMHVYVIHQHLVKNVDQLLAYEEQWVKKGFEGLMARDPLAPYKQGRSTLDEQCLMKLKRFVDSEAEILDVEEMMHNENEATRDARGYTKRSKRQEGMVPAGMLGRFLCRDRKYFDEDFYIGTGKGFLTRDDRIELWKIRDKLPTRKSKKFLKYRFQQVGVKDRPRFVRALGFRHKDDL